MNNSLLSQIAALDKLSPQELEERWRQLTGKEPPAYNRRFLIKRLTYRLQELKYGGLSEGAKQQLEIIAGEIGWNGNAPLASKNSSGKRTDLPVVGTRLIREWNGKRYEVTVLPRGFEFEGKPYRSLTAITKAITGTHWNGRAFFGLRSPVKEEN
jgi:hypothetical protein